MLTARATVRMPVCLSGSDPICRLDPH